MVRGRVADVERGAEVRYQDGSGAVVTPRILVVPVDHYLFSRHAGSPRPSEMRVVDGYWEEGEGYAQSEAGWLQPGDPIVRFVSRDRAPDGSPMDTYTPLGTEGRVVLDVERPEYDSAAGSVWAYLGERASAAELEVAIDQAVSRARSGEARPVLVTVCFPSDPQDEDSEPICKEM